MKPSRSNPVVHLELHTGDLPQARALYAELCGWRPSQIETRAGSYLAMGLGGTLGGGIVECATSQPLWLPYVEVTEFDEAPRHAGSARRLRAAGAARGPGGLAQRRRHTRGRRDRLLAAEEPARGMRWAS